MICFVFKEFDFQLKDCLPELLIYVCRLELYVMNRNGILTPIYKDEASK